MLHHSLPILHHLQLSPEDAEDYIKYLLTIGKLDEAAIKMADIVNDEGFVSKELGQVTAGTSSGMNCVN